MARIASAQQSFARGQISEKLWERSDLELYFTALAKCQNYVVTGQGLLEKRPGTMFVQATKGNDPATLIPFGFSLDTSYMIEFGQMYARFFSTYGPVMNGMVQSEIVTPYLASDTQALSRAQNGKEMFIMHGDYAPKVLRRLTPNTFSLDVYDTADGPYLDINNDTTKTLATEAGGVMTATGFAPFLPSDVGRWVRIRVDNPDPPTDPDLEDLFLWKIGRIDGYINAAQVHTTIGAGVGPSGVWRLGAFWTGNNPDTVAVHQNRLALSKGSRIYLSKPFDYITFSPTAINENGDATDYVLPNSSITVVLDSANAQNGILPEAHWMRSLNSQLVIGTPAGIATVQASAFGDGLRPDNVTVRWQDSRGVSICQPVQVGDSLLFAHVTGRRLQATYYKEGSYDRIGSQDLSNQSDTLMTGEIVQLAWQDYPHSILWMCLSDGNWRAVTLQPEEQVQAWHSHQAGGRVIENGRILHANIESVAVMPSADGSMADQWIIARRTIDGEERRYIEVMRPFWTKGTDTRDAWYLDSGLLYDGNNDPAKTLSFAVTTPNADWTVTSNFTSPAFSPMQKISFYDGVRWHRGTIITVFGSNDFTFRPATPNAPPARADGRRWFWNGTAWFQPAEDAYFDANNPSYESPRQTNSVSRWSIAQDDFSGLDHLVGEQLQALLDGYPTLLATTGEDGSITFGAEASVACVGLRYESEGALLSVEAGAQAGSAKEKQRPYYSREINLWESYGMEIGSGQLSGYGQSWANFEPMDDVFAPPFAEGEPPPLFTGNVELRGSDNWKQTDPAFAWRNRQPLPCFVRGVLVRLSTSDGK